MNTYNKFTLIFVAIATACGNSNNEMAQTPFERYPHSDYYFYPGDICIDSMINENGNPVFILENSDRVRTFVELEDTFVIIDGYLAHGSYYTEDQKIRIMNNLKFYEK